ncbi:MAG: peptidoglycan-binding protein, partial [Pseudomonadales bacterium]|nr:peptidoglycan-binding protein [Pseudomonadales bacterium]
CDRALLGAYVENRPLVDSRIVTTAAREILGPAPARPSSLLNAGLAASLLLAMVGAVYYYTLPRIAPATTTTSLSEANTVEPATEDGKDSDAPSRPLITATTTPAVTATVTTTPIDDIAGHESRREAFIDLYALWQTPYSPDQDPCVFASTVELQCMTGIGSLREIGYLNRPVLIPLSTARGERWFTVTGLEPATVEIRAGDDHFVVDRRALLASWNGVYSMLWRPPPTWERPIQRGDRGADVAWLAHRLDRIENTESAVQPEADFDSLLESRVKRFQISAGLKPDGIVGTRTWIHINTRINEDIPLLNEGLG